jgi:hypothetical protein
MGSNGILHTGFSPLQKHTAYLLRKSVLHLLQQSSKLLNAVLHKLLHVMAKHSVPVISGVNHISGVHSHHYRI